MTEEHQNQVVEAIRNQLPPELIDSIVKKSLSECFRHFSFKGDLIEKLVLEAVIERAKEMIRTTYKDDVEKQATLLSARVVESLPRLVFKEERRY